MRFLSSRAMRPRFEWGGRKITHKLNCRSRTQVRASQIRQISSFHSSRPNQVVRALAWCYADKSPKRITARLLSRIDPMDRGALPGLSYPLRKAPDDWGNPSHFEPTFLTFSCLPSQWRGIG